MSRACLPLHSILPSLIWSRPMNRVPARPPRSVVVGIVIAFGVALAACAGGPQTRAPDSSEGSAHPTFVFVGTAAGTIEGLSLEGGSNGGAAANGGAPSVGPVGLTPRTKIANGGTPAALTNLPFGKMLVALDDKAGAIVAYEVEGATGALHPTGHGSSAGSKPGRITLDHSGKYVLVTNQASASVAVLAVGPGGHLSPPDLFPAAAGAFGLALHPSNTMAFVANAKAGTLSQLTFNVGTGTLTAKPGAAIGLPWGSGPKLVVCHPRGRWVYVLNETNNTVSVHSFDDRMGTVSRLAFQVVSVAPSDATGEPAGAAAGEGKPAGPSGGKSAKAAAKTEKAVDKVRPREMAVAVSGRFAYVLDGARDDLATFAIDDETGGLTLVDHEPSGGTGAVGLALDPTGQFLIVVHQGSRQVAAFHLDPKTGVPSLADSTRLANAPVSVTVIKVAAGN
jgi:6-phosphogluconolactonase